MNKTEELREEIEVKINRFDTFREEYSYAMLAREILQACNQWLEGQGASHRVKCPHCSWSQFADGEMVGMSPCYECNSTGYTLEPLRLEMKHPVSNHGFRIRSEVGIANKEQREQKAEAKNYDIYHSENIYEERSYLAGKQAGMEYGNQKAYEIGVEDGKVEGIAEGLREVIEFIESREQDDGIDSLFYFVIEKDEWQAFKKERGL